MENVFDLIEPIEGWLKVKVNHEIDNEHVNGDLGILVEEVNGEIVFVGKYTSAVIDKTNIKDYV